MTAVFQTPEGFVGTASSGYRTTPYARGMGNPGSWNGRDAALRRARRFLASYPNPSTGHRDHFARGWLRLDLDLGLVAHAVIGGPVDR